MMGRAGSSTPASAAGRPKQQKAAREMMAIVGAGGGYIAGPTHYVPRDVPPGNIVALVEAFQEQ